MTDAYLDCELYVTDRDQARLSCGQDYEGQPDLSEDFEKKLASLHDQPESYGAALFSATLVGRLLRGYRNALIQAQQQEARLRLRLRVATTAPAALHGLRWELLYDPEDKVALGGSQEIAFSRYLSFNEPLRQPVEERPKLLVALANPKNLESLGLSAFDRDLTRQGLENTLKPLAGHLSLDFLPATRVDHLRKRLVDGGIHAVHLQAHGLRQSRDSGDETCLVLEDEAGNAALVDEKILSEVFGDIRTLRLVTLIACHGGAQPRDDPFSGLGPGLLRLGIPAVVAMRKEISFGAAARFCEHFYHNLARGGCVDAAVNEARRQLALSTLEEAEFGTPVLFMRLADGLLWKTRQPEPTPTPTDSEFDWGGLVDSVRNDSLLPFLGPGLWRGLLPSRAEIALRWIEEYGEVFPLDARNELPAVAQVLERSKVGSRPREKMLRLLAAELKSRQPEPEREELCDLTLSQVIAKTGPGYFDQHADDPYRILAELPLSTYVTTNPDSFLTAALLWAKKQPLREHCPWRRPPDSKLALKRYKLLKGTRKDQRTGSISGLDSGVDAPLVFHLYGSDEAPSSLVLTEDDHLDFLFARAHGDAELPEDLNRKLADSTLLFLGYDVRRLDCRVLLRGLVDELKEAPHDRIAVLQIDPEDQEHGAELAAYMAKCCKRLQINVYSGSVQDFLVTLRKRWKER